MPPGAEVLSLVAGASVIAAGVVGDKRVVHPAQPRVSGSMPGAR